MSSSRGFIWLDKKTSDGFNGGNIILNDNSVIQFNGGDTIITNDNVTANEMIYDDAYEKTPGHGNTHHNKMNFQDDVTIDSTKLLYVDNIIPTADEVVRFPYGLSGYMMTDRIDESTSLAGITLGNNVAIMGDLSVGNIELDNIYGTNINLTATAFVNVTGGFGMKVDNITGYNDDTLNINSTMTAVDVNVNGHLTLANESLLKVNNIIGSDGFTTPRFPNGLTVETSSVWTANIAGIDEGPVNINAPLNTNEINSSGAVHISSELHVVANTTVEGLLDAASAKFVDTETNFHNAVDPTKRFRFDGNLIATGQTRVYFMPSLTTTLTGTDSTQTLTNKTIVGASNTVAASGLRTNTGSTVQVITSAPPTVGQVLTATSASNATWQTPIASIGETSSGSVITSTGIIAHDFSVFCVKTGSHVVNCRIQDLTAVSNVGASTGTITIPGAVPVGYRPGTEQQVGIGYVVYNGINDQAVSFTVTTTGNIIIRIVIQSTGAAIASSSFAVTSVPFQGKITSVSWVI